MELNGEDDWLKQFSTLMDYYSIFIPFTLSHTVQCIMCIEWYAKPVHCISALAFVSSGNEVQGDEFLNWKIADLRGKGVDICPVHWWHQLSDYNIVHRERVLDCEQSTAKPCRLRNAMRSLRWTVPTRTYERQAQRTTNLVACLCIVPPGRKEKRTRKRAPKWSRAV